MRFVRTAESIWNIPAGFQRVEYLQSSGGAYIDTGYVFQNLNHSTTITFKGLAAGSGGQPYHIFGSNKDNNRSGALSGISGNNNYIGIGIGGHGSGSSTERVATPTTPKTMTVVSKSTNKFDWIVDGTKVYSDVSFTGSSLSGISEYIFGINFTSDLTASTTVYHYQAEDNGVIVRDMIPCIDPLGAPCMYDLVGKKPYYNQGTGTFTVGRQVIPVEYLESTGTQYIDTGYVPTNTTGVQVKHTICADNSTDNIIFGCRQDSQNTRFWQDLDWSNDDSVQWGYGIYSPIDSTYSIYRYKLISSDIGKTVISRLNYLNSRNCSIDDNIRNLPQTTLPTITRPIYIFAANNQGNAGYFTNFKVFCLQISEGTSLVRDFIPCKDENNVGFMFDKVSGTCYLNAGTGAFIVGENKYTSKLRLIRDAIRIPDGYTRVEYLESTGTQYIDTGVIYNDNTGLDVGFSFTPQTITSAKHLIGGQTNDTRYNPLYCTVVNGSNKIRTLLNINGSANITRDFDTDYHTLQFNTYSNKRVVYDGAVEGTVESIGTGNSINLFRRNFSTGYAYCNGRLYYVKLYNGSNIVRSFIPVRDSNNVGYMYDEVTGQLFGNAGFGSFGIGNDLPTAKVRFIQDVLPREYRPLKYLESTGTQYIDTGTTLSNNTAVDMKIGTTTPWERMNVFGARESANSKNIGIVVGNPGTASGEVIDVDFNSSNYATYRAYTNYTKNTDYIIHIDKNYRKINNVSNTSVCDDIFTTTTNAYLFSMSGTPPSGNVSFTGKVYFCKLWDNGVLVRDFYPALRKSDNKPGMYDRITKQFFVNAAQSGNDFNYEV